MVESTKKKQSHILVKSGYFLLVVVVVLSVLYSFYQMFMPLIFSVLLSFLLEPLVNFLESKGYSRLKIVLGIYVSATLAIGLAVWLLVPVVTNQIHTITENLPTYRTMVGTTIDNMQNMVQQQFPKAQLPNVKEMIKARLSGGGSGTQMTFMVKFLSSFASIMSMVFLIPIISFFFLVDARLIRRAMIGLVPNRYFEMTVLLLHRILSALKLFLRGQLIDALAVAVLTSIGLSIIGLPYSILIGVIAGVGNLIPYLGPIIGFIPAALVLLMSPEGITMMPLLSVIIVFVLVQFIEGTFIYPFAVGKSVDLHPLIVILGVTVGGQVAGLLGMLLIVPIICICKVSLEVLFHYLKSYSII